MFQPFSKIPEEYRAELISGLTFCIRKRLRVLCYSFLSLAALHNLISFFLMPNSFYLERRIPYWVVLILGISAILYLNTKVCTYLQAKLAAYLYTIFLLSYITFAAFCLKPSGAFFSAITILILTLFFISV